MISPTDMSEEKQAARIKRSTDKLLKRLKAVHGPKPWTDVDPNTINHAPRPERELIQAARSLG